MMIFSQTEELIDKLSKWNASNIETSITLSKDEIGGLLDYLKSLEDKYENSLYDEY